MFGKVELLSLSACSRYYFLFDLSINVRVRKWIKHIKVPLNIISLNINGTISFWVVLLFWQLNFRNLLFRISKSIIHASIANNFEKLLIV